MKFLEKLDFFKPIGKGLAELDRFVDREMPFDSGWGLPAALVAAYYGGPAVLNAMGGSATGAAGGAAGGASSVLGGGSGAGAMTAGNSMLANFGLDAGTGFAASNGASFALPSSAYTPEYLNMLAAQNGVDLGDPTFFQRFTGNTEQGLYNPKEMSSSKLLSELLKSRGEKSKPMQQQLQQITQQPSQQTMAQQGPATYEDLNEPFYDQNLTQQERSRKLLAQQLRLLKPKMTAEKPQFSNMDIQSLLSNFKV
jgi:hypothetical protein